MKRNSYLDDAVGELAVTLASHHSSAKQNNPINHAGVSVGDVKDAEVCNVLLGSSRFARIKNVWAVDCWMLSRTATHKRLCGKWKDIGWLSAWPNLISWTLATDN
jgi:hypothetical protein